MDVVFDHIAFAVAEIAGCFDFMGGRLGGRPDACGPGRGFSWAQWSFARGELLELIEGDGRPRGFVDRFLARHGTGIHHVTFKVPDIAEAARACRLAGYNVVGYDDANPGWKELFLHPKEAGGIVVQMAEAHPDLDEGLADLWPFPPPGAVARQPAAIVGLAMSAASPESASRQWQDLLGAEVEKVEGGTTVYKWPRSPLRISVSIDENTEPGPLGLQIKDGDPEAGTSLETDLGRILGTRLLTARPDDSPAPMAEP
ncbi:MAG: VOC family protein [Deltaproteobacteria bacterium]